jgi:membrane protein required for colicin V production
LYKGFTKGFIIEVATLVAFGLAVWSGIKFSDFLSEWMKNYFHWTTKYLPIISFAVIFIGILILVFALAKLIQRFAKAVALGFVNKLAGGIFGMLKFGLILSVLIFVLNAIEKSISFIPTETKHSSLLYEPVGKIAPLIIPGLKESKLEKIIPDSVSVNIKVP